MSKITDYDKLRAIWYEKLKTEGFHDIESNDDNLKVWSSRFARENSIEVWQAKSTYYIMATNFLHDYNFKSPLERIVWEYHSNAISVRDTVDILSSTGVSSLGRDAIWLIIKRLEKIMKDMYMSGNNNE